MKLKKLKLVPISALLFLLIALSPNADAGSLKPKPTLKNGTLAKPSSVSYYYLQSIAKSGFYFNTSFGTNFRIAFNNSTLDYEFVDSSNQIIGSDDYRSLTISSGVLEIHAVLAPSTVYPFRDYAPDRVNFAVKYYGTFFPAGGGAPVNQGLLTTEEYTVYF